MQRMRPLAIAMYVLLMVLFIDQTLFSQITVSGAGSTEVDGTYDSVGVYSDRTYYMKPGSQMIMWRPECGNAWTINNGSGYVYYLNYGNTTLPPTGGWIVSNSQVWSAPGIDPVPTLTGNVDPLPVQLAGMSASVSGNNVTLTWNTATEMNNAGFEVERRAMVGRPSDVDGLWRKVGFILGPGTSTSPLKYSWTEQVPMPDPETPVFRYAYRLKQTDHDGSFSFSHEVEVEVAAVAKEFCLGEAFPNPFNPATSIEFSLAEPSVVSLKIYNVLGQEVATLFTGAAEAGRLYRATWEASGAPSGMYFARLESGSASAMKRLLLVK